MRLVLRVLWVCISSYLYMQLHKKIGQLRNGQRRTLFSFLQGTHEMLYFVGEKQITLMGMSQILSHNEEVKSMTQAQNNLKEGGNDSDTSLVS